MLKKIFIFFIFVLFIFWININFTFANEKNKQSILFLLEDYLNNTVSSEKKYEILANEKFKLALWEKISHFKFNQFNYSTFLRNTEINKITFSDDVINISYNKYAWIVSWLNDNLKEFIRNEIIKEIIKKHPDIVKNELQRFIINVDNQWELIIEENTYYKWNIKKDIISTDIDMYFNKNKEDLILISDNIQKNIYYNYLINDSLIAIMDLNINDYKNTLIFRNIDDVKKLLVVNSYRYRDKYSWDAYYRQYNINQIYKSFNYIIWISPWEEISFNDLYMKDDSWDKFMEWKALIKGEEETIYWWWVCGWATWIYQWSLSNWNLQLNAINHSAWFAHWYEANIDWTFIKKPWLDSTYYWNWLDLKIKNISEYPVFIWANIDKNKSERNFTLSFKWDYEKLDITFLKQEKNCFYWLRWDETIKSCYTRWYE